MCHKEHKPKIMEISLKEQLYKGEHDPNGPLPVRIRILIPGERDFAIEVAPAVTREVFEEAKTINIKAFENINGLDEPSVAKVRIETAKWNIQAVALVLTAQQKFSKNHLRMVLDHATALKRKEREQFKYVLSDPHKTFDAVAAVNAALGSVKGSQHQEKSTGDTTKPFQAVVVQQAVNTVPSNGIIQQFIAPAVVATTDTVQQPVRAPGDYIIVSKEEPQPVILEETYKKEISFTKYRELAIQHPEYTQEAILKALFRDTTKKGKNGG
jgi:hypothetical protein